MNNNIADLEEDVLVNAANNRLMMGGGVAAALRSRGGIAIHQEAIKHAPAKIGSVIVTGTRKLKAKFVYHAVVIDYDVSKGTDVPSVREAIKNIILRARQDDVTSMALPFFGAGVGGLGIDRSLETILDSLEEFSGLLTNTLRVTIAIQDEDEFKLAEIIFREHKNKESRRKEECRLAEEFLQEFLKQKKSGSRSK